MRRYKFKCSRETKDTLEVSLYTPADGVGFYLWLTARAELPLAAGGGAHVVLTVEDAKKLKKAINKFLKEAEEE